MTPIAAPRRRAIRPGLLGLVVVAGLLAWGAIRLQHHWDLAALTPDRREVRLEIRVVDQDTGATVAGAEVGLDHETGDFSHEGPIARAWVGPDGVARLGGSFHAVTRRDRDGVVRGKMRFDGGGPMMSEPYFLVIRAPGYRDGHENLHRSLTNRIPYEDPAPVRVEVRLVPVARAASATEPAPP